LVELKVNLSEYRQADVIIDAIFGTGLDREVEGFYKEAIEFINTQPVPCVSVDLPSGLDANTGFPLGLSVKADVTVTFVLPKLGLAIYPGIEYAGKVYVVDITTPKFLGRDIPYELVTYHTVGKILKPRQPNTHKGTFGHLFVLSGSPGKTGAATLVVVE